MQWWKRSHSVTSSGFTTMNSTGRGSWGLVRGRSRTCNGSAGTRCTGSAGRGTRAVTVAVTFSTRSGSSTSSSSDRDCAMGVKGSAFVPLTHSCRTFYAPPPRHQPWRVKHLVQHQHQYQRLQQHQQRNQGPTRAAQTAQTAQTAPHLPVSLSPDSPPQHRILNRLDPSNNHLVTIAKIATLRLFASTFSRGLPPSRTPRAQRGLFPSSVSFCPTRPRPSSSTHQHIVPRFLPSRLFSSSPRSSSSTIMEGQEEHRWSAPRVRQTFLDFFAQKEHTIGRSSYLLHQLD